MNPPFLLVHDDGSIEIRPLIEPLASWIEADDVRTEEFRLYDSAGTRIPLVVRRARKEFTHFFWLVKSHGFTAEPFANAAGAYAAAGELKLALTEYVHRYWPGEKAEDSLNLLIRQVEALTGR